MNFTNHIKQLWAIETPAAAATQCACADAGGTEAGWVVYRIWNLISGPNGNRNKTAGSSRPEKDNQAGVASNRTLSVLI